MAKKNKADLTPSERYFNFVHGFGRWGLLLATILLILIPVIVCTVYDCWPPLGPTLTALLGVAAIWVPMGITGVFSYGPIMGSGSYLAYLTGNILNTRVPCAINAMKMADVEQGTEAGDAISTVAIASSAFVTVFVMMIGAIMMGPLMPLLDTEPVKIAIDYLLPSLFGGMFLGFFNTDIGGGKAMQGKWLAVLPAMLLVALMSYVGIAKTGMEGILIIVMLPVTIIATRIGWKKGIIKVRDKAEYAAEKAAKKAAKKG